MPVSPEKHTLLFSRILSSLAVCPVSLQEKNKSVSVLVFLKPDLSEAKLFQKSDFELMEKLPELF